MSKISKKSKMIASLCAGLVAIVALTVALCFSFMATRAVKDVPQQISVQEVDGQVNLVATYASGYGYCFKIEQNFDGEYVEIQQVQTSQNYLSLDECSVTLSGGEVLRFSACYTKETSKGDFCEALEWTATSTLGAVDFSTIENNDGTLSWGQVSGADGYSVVVVSSSGQSQQFDVSSAQFSLQQIGSAGSFVIYISATSSKTHVLSSAATAGYAVEVTMQNQITDAYFSSAQTIVATCTLSASEFEVVLNGTSKGTLVPSEGFETSNGFTYVLDVSALLYEIEDGDVVEIRTCQNGYVLASELVEVK